MSNQISLQANQLWRLISAPTTAAIYQQALSLSWTILKETGKLLWLLFCMALVGFDWFWNRSVRLGRQARAWFNRFDRTNDIAAEEMWQGIVSSTQSSFGAVVTKARKQLGLYSKPEIGSTSSAIVPSAGTEIAPVSSVLPMQRYEAAGEDEPVILSGGFMTSNQPSPAENPSASSSEVSNSSETIETNAEPETVAVKTVSPQQKEQVGEDEEVEASPLKDPLPASNS